MYKYNPLVVASNYQPSKIPHINRSSVKIRFRFAKIKERNEKMNEIIEEIFNYM